QPTPQPEEPAPIHPPELRIEREGDARVVGRLEIVSAADTRIEVPPGELESRQQPEPAVSGEIARALRRAQAQGTGAVDRRDRHREADRRERIAGRAAHLEADPVAIPTQRAGRVYGALSPVGRIERRPQVVRPGEVAVEREPCWQNQTRGQMGAIAGAPAAVFGVAAVARERKTGKRAPRAGCFELPRP